MHLNLKYTYAQQIGNGWIPESCGRSSKEDHSSAGVLRLSRYVHQSETTSVFPYILQEMSRTFGC